MTVFDDLVSAANPTIATWSVARQAGASWEMRIPLYVDGTAMDWTGCTGSAKIYTASGVTVYTFTSVVLTTGLVTITATPTNTAALIPGTYEYGVDIVNASSRRLALLEGKFKITKAGA